MSTSAILPVGTEQDQKSMMVSKGDVILLVTGEKMTFIEMKRTKFIATENGSSYNVPKYRRPGVPFIKEIIGKDESVFKDSVSYKDLKNGELFYIEGSKQTFMFIEVETKRTGKIVVKAIDLASNDKWSLGTSFTTYYKINIDRLRAKIRK